MVDLKYIEELNSKANQLNMERQRQLGIVSQAEETLHNGLNAYNQQFGTNVTVDTILEEFNAEEAKIQSAAEALKKQLEYIESGAYKEVKTEPKPTVTGTDGLIVQPATTNVPQGVIPTNAPPVVPAPVPAPQGVMPNNVSQPAPVNMQPVPAPSNPLSAINNTINTNNTPLPFGNVGSAVETSANAPTPPSMPSNANGVVTSPIMPNGSENGSTVAPNVNAIMSNMLGSKFTF